MPDPAFDVLEDRVSYARVLKEVYERSANPRVRKELEHQVPPVHDGRASPCSPVLVTRPSPVRA